MAVCDTVSITSSITHHMYVCVKVWPLLVLRPVAQAVISNPNVMWNSFQSHNMCCLPHWVGEGCIHNVTLFVCTQMSM